MSHLFVVEVLEPGNALPGSGVHRAAVLIAEALRETLSLTLVGDVRKIDQTTAFLLEPETRALFFAQQEKDLVADVARYIRFRGLDRSGLLEALEDGSWKEHLARYDLQVQEPRPGLMDFRCRHGSRFTWAPIARAWRAERSRSCDCPEPVSPEVTP